MGDHHAGGPRCGIVRLTSSTVTSWRPGPINYGSRTSPTSRRGGASSTSPSSSTCSRDALSAGACRLRSRTDFVLDALEQAIYDRRGDGAGDLVHHSDRGTQYLSMRYTERLADRRASRCRSAVAATRTTTPSPKQSSVCSRRR